MKFTIIDINLWYNLKSFNAKHHENKADYRISYIVKFKKYFLNILNI